MHSHREEVLETLHSAYNDIVVERRGKTIDLEVAGATFATWHPDNYLTGYSWDALSAGCLLYPGGSPQSVLVLGLAGGTATRQLRHLLPPDAELTAIEIDPAVVRLGRKFMHLDEQDLTIITDDAYAFLEETDRTFDVIADDIYLTGETDVLRPVPMSRKLLRTFKDRLNPGGILVGNFITEDGHEPTYVQATRAFRAQFPLVKVLTPPRGYNRILVGGTELAGKAALKDISDRFGRQHDRELWKQLTVRRLGD